MKKINFNRKTKGFTLAETLITLTILGVVAAITVPMLINKQMEAANRTKLKKAMAAYEKALNQMIIDNDVKGDIASALNTAGCTITSPYFKPVKTATSNNCRFQTADKVWWDITDIEHPLISLKDEITDDNIATLKGNADSLDDDKTSFVMVGEIKDGIVRINDKGATTASPDSLYVSKLYNFINNTSSGGADGNADPYAAYRNECTSCSMQSMMMAIARGIYSDDCKSCTKKFTEDGFDGEVIFNENGIAIYSENCIEGSKENCSYSKRDEYDREIENLTNTDCSNGYNYDECYITRSTYLSENSKTGRITNYYDLNNNFKEQSIFIADNGKDKYYYTGCDEQGMNCKDKYIVTSWDYDGTYNGIEQQSCIKAEDIRCIEFVDE